MRFNPASNRLADTTTRLHEVADPAMGLHQVSTAGAGHLAASTHLQATAAAACSHAHAGLRSSRDGGGVCEIRKKREKGENLRCIEPWPMYVASRMLACRLIWGQQYRSKCTLYLEEKELWANIV